MKTDSIVISHFEFLAITNLEIERTIRDHASAKVTGYIRDEDVDEYQEKLLRRT